jgi:hypothetical protein
VQCLVSVLPLFGDWIYAASGTRSLAGGRSRAFTCRQASLEWHIEPNFATPSNRALMIGQIDASQYYGLNLRFAEADRFFCENLACLAGIWSTLSEAICKSSTMFKTWFITGGSSGFGRALTETLLARGDSVTATVRKVHVLDDLKTQYAERISVAWLIDRYGGSAPRSRSH